MKTSRHDLIALQPPGFVTTSFARVLLDSLVDRCLKVERLIFILLLAIHLLPIWVFPYFPTQDGPNHVDNAAAFYHFLQGDEPFLREYYTLNLRLVPNWLTNLALAGLIGFASPVVADKILLSGYVILFAFSIRYALGVLHQGSTFLSLLAFPLIYNNILYFGFYNFIFSVPLFFFTLGYWLRHRERLNVRNICCLAALLLILYFAHIVGLIALVATLFILAIALTFPFHSLHREGGWLRGLRGMFYNSTWLSLLVGVAPALGLVAMFILQQASYPHVSPPLWPEYTWKFFLWPLYGMIAIANTPAHLLVSVAIVGTLLAVLCYTIRERTPRRNTALWCGLLLAAAGAALLYFVAPITMSGGTGTNPRFVLFALCLLIVAFGTYQFTPREKFTIGTAAAGLAVLQIGLNTPVYARINSDAAEYLSPIELIKPRSTLVALCFASEGCTVGTKRGYLRIDPLLNLSGYISAERNSVNLFLPAPHTNYFPIRYLPHLNAARYLRTEDVRGTRVWVQRIGDYARETGGRIDYVLLWRVSDAWNRGENTAHLFGWLAENYELIFTSATNQLHLYRHKGARPFDESTVARSVSDEPPEKKSDVAPEQALRNGGEM
jgi:hypothetical protein